MPLITVLYICANIAFFTVLSKEEMLAANAVAVVSTSDFTITVVLTLQ